MTAIVKHFDRCRTVTGETRELLHSSNVETREIYYEDIYGGERETRLLHLNGLLEFLGFMPETIEAHRADLEDKIFNGGLKTANILPFVPNLTEVTKALAKAGCRGDSSALVERIGRRRPGTGVGTHETRISYHSEGSRDRGRQPMETSWPGSAKPTMPIFTRENGFVLESGLGYHARQLNRLNARYRTFILPNAEQYGGKRVLDLASHDGRWSFAALMTGAAHVTGVEFRQELIDKSRFILKGEMRERVRFIQGDIFDIVPRLLEAGERFDIIHVLEYFITFSTTIGCSS